MPSTSIISNFTNAKSYSVGSFTGSLWSDPSNALTSNAAATSSGGNNSYTQALGMRGLAGYLQIPDSATISGIIITVIIAMKELEEPISIKLEMLPKLI